MMQLIPFLATTLTLLTATVAATDTPTFTVNCNSLPCTRGTATYTARWAARQEYCGTNRWKTQTWFWYSPTTSASRVGVQLNPMGALDAETCFAAFEAIIEGCAVGGNTTYNGATYQLGVCYR